MPVVDQGDQEQNDHDDEDDGEYSPRTNLAVNLEGIALTKHEAFEHHDEHIGYALMNVSRCSQDQLPFFDRRGNSL